MRKHMLVIIVFIILSIISIFLIFQVNTNYDLTIYLPDDSMTSEGLNILEDEFGSHTAIEVMLDGESMDSALALKSLLSDIDHVEQVVWLDDYIDLNTTPMAYIPESLLSNFYIDDHMLFTIILDLDTYDVDVDQVIIDIREVLDQHIYALRGDTIIEMENRLIASKEMINIMLIIVPIIIVLLIITSKSYFDPIIAIISLGVAVLLNVGSNAFLPNISFITKTLALALQLALSIDYTLFYLHRYHEERDEHDRLSATKIALKRTFPAITASALTTIAGFLALLLMQYKIGLDIGLVLTKGIFLSYLTTLLLVPVITLYLDKYIMKFKHKTLILVPKKLFKHFKKFMIVIAVMFIGVIIFGLYFQSQTTYTYGTNQDLDPSDQTYIDQEAISDVFGNYQQMVILIPNDMIAKEVSLAQALYQNDSVLSVDTLVTQVDPQIDCSYIDPNIVGAYVGTNYTKMIVKTTVTEENDEMYQFYDDIKNMVSTYYDDYYILGFAASASEIKDIVTSDTLLITIVSIIGIFIILSLTFKNFIVPIGLILIIESAIWVNIGLLAIMDINTIFIGYLVVMSIQLGATIDYAVLLSSRYIEYRRTHQKIESLNMAYHKSLVTVVISAFILSLAGFTEGLFSNIETIKDIGFLLGKGSLISLLFTIIFLPLILYVLDRFINKKIQ